MPLSSTSQLADGSFRVARAFLGIAWRGLRTALLRAAIAGAVFVLAAAAVDRFLLGGDDALGGVPPGALYVLYVLAGVLLGGYAGMAAAMERAAPALVNQLADVVEPLFVRTLDRLPLREGALDATSLRELADTELRVPTRALRLLRPRSAIFEYAALNTLRDRVLAVADAIEADEPVDAREALAAIVRDGMVTGLEGELAAYWRTARLFATGLAVAALLALPALAIAFG